jgi:predicted secreted protein
MSIAELFVVYVIIWWLVLFMVLPFGITRVDPDTLLPGQDPGSPAKGRMILKLCITSGIALVLLIAYYFVATSGFISFREMAK